MGGDGWGVAVVGILVAARRRLLLGHCSTGSWSRRRRCPPLIVTLGSLSVALGLAQVITGGVDIRSAPEAPHRLQHATSRSSASRRSRSSRSSSSIIGGIVLHKTKFGRYTYAVGSNELGARRVGIKVDRHLIMVYALSGLMAGFGAVLSLAQFGTTTIAGQSLTNLNVIAAVVIGGTSIFGGEGSIFGTVVGLFIPAVLQAGFVIIGVEALLAGRRRRNRPGRRRLRRPVPPRRGAARGETAQPAAPPCSSRQASRKDPDATPSSPSRLQGSTILPLPVGGLHPAPSPRRARASGRRARAGRGRTLPPRPR